MSATSCVKFFEKKIFIIIFLSLIFTKLTDEEEIQLSETDDENDVDYLSSADTGSTSDILELIVRLRKWNVIPEGEIN